MAKETVTVRYYPDGRVTIETRGLKGVKCEEVTNDVFKKLNTSGRGETQNTNERYQGGDGSKRTLSQG